eukprot:GHVL01018978.1.p1 GENE.GHVL01018978.1~~GHVL01018978.1.p1  ORF type:complete len:804 (+),score=129.49 GHVL01018978.1:69-2480(+)
MSNLLELAKDVMKKVQSATGDLFLSSENDLYQDSLYIIAFNKLFQRARIEFLPASSAENQANNIQAILDFLSKKVLKVELYHLTGNQIVHQHNQQATRNLLLILKELASVPHLKKKLQKNTSSTNSPVQFNGADRQTHLQERKRDEKQEMSDSRDTSKTHKAFNIRGTFEGVVKMDCIDINNFRPDSNFDSQKTSLKISSPSTKKNTGVNTSPEQATSLHQAPSIPPPSSSNAVNTSSIVIEKQSSDSSNIEPPRLTEIYKREEHNRSVISTNKHDFAETAAVPPASRTLRTRTYSSHIQTSSSASSPDLTNFQDVLLKDKHCKTRTETIPLVNNPVDCCDSHSHDHCIQSNTQSSGASQSIQQIQTEDFESERINKERIDKVDLLDTCFDIADRRCCQFRERPKTSSVEMKDASISIQSLSSRSSSPCITQYCSTTAKKDQLDCTKQNRGTQCSSSKSISKEKQVIDSSHRPKTSSGETKDAGISIQYFSSRSSSPCITKHLSTTARKDQLGCSKKNRNTQCSSTRAMSNEKQVIDSSHRRCVSHETAGSRVRMLPSNSSTKTGAVCQSSSSGSSVISCRRKSSVPPCERGQTVTNRRQRAVQIREAHKQCELPLEAKKLQKELSSPFKMPSRHSTQKSNTKSSELECFQKEFDDTIKKVRMALRGGCRCSDTMDLPLPPPPPPLPHGAMIASRMTTKEGSVVDIAKASGRQNERCCGSKTRDEAMKTDSDSNVPMGINYQFDMSSSAQMLSSFESQTPGMSAFVIDQEHNPSSEQPERASSALNDLRKNHRQSSTQRSSFC